MVLIRSGGIKKRCTPTNNLEGGNRKDVICVGFYIYRTHNKLDQQSSQISCRRLDCLQQ